MDVREYDLNLIPGSVPQIIKINQYDKGIPFQFTIYQGDQKFSIPDGSTVLLTGTKPDGLGFTYSCTFSGAVASVTIGDQVAVLSGNVWAELTITSGDSVRLGTANFTFCVEPAALKDDTAVSDSDFPEIIKAVNNIGAAQKSADAAAKSAQDAKSSASSAASAAKNAIADEVARAKAAEKANADAISAEVTRAKAAEKTNADAIENLSTVVSTKASLVATGTQILPGSDLNDLKYTAVGSYFCRYTADAATLKNTPEKVAFIMSVYNPLTKDTGKITAAWQYRLQEFLPHHGEHKYIRAVSTESDASALSYGDWKTEY